MVPCSTLAIVRLANKLTNIAPKSVQSFLGHSVLDHLDFIETLVVSVTPDAGVNLQDVVANEPGHVRR